MPTVVAFLSQKGGVGKSTLARGLAAVAAYDMRVRLADLDTEQATAIAWERTRSKHYRAPACDVVACHDVSKALNGTAGVDLLVIDAPARSGRAALEVARAADLVVQPTGASADDLRPAVLLFHELVKAGVPRERLVAAVCRTMSDTEEAAVRAYMRAAGYEVLAGSIPERAAYRQAQNRGAGINETPVRALNARTDTLMTALLSRVRENLRPASRNRARGHAR